MGSWLVLKLVTLNDLERRFLSSVKSSQTHALLQMTHCNCLGGSNMLKCDLQKACAHCQHSNCDFTNDPVVQKVEECCYDDTVMWKKQYTKHGRHLKLVLNSSICTEAIGSCPQNFGSYLGFGRRTDTVLRSTFRGRLTTMWVNRPLKISQLGQLSLSSFRGR